MSIPPLVCSTPPPPEQVECEDVGNDDFAISYDLSQEDDDSCIYDDLQSAVPSSPYYLTRKSDNTQVVNKFRSVSPDICKDSSKIDNVYGKILHQDKKSTDVDNNIEDLDLKCESLTNKLNLDHLNTSDGGLPKNNILEDSTLGNVSNVGINASINENLPESNEDLEVLEKQDKHKIKTEYSNILDVSVYSQNNEKLQNSEFSNENVLRTDFSHAEKHKGLSTEREEDFSDFYFVPTEINLETEVLDDLGFHKNLDVLVDNETEHVETHTTSYTDDDFDTFQFNNTKSKTVDAIENLPNGNPWQSDISVNDIIYFQATFDNVSSDTLASKFAEIDHASANETFDEGDDEFGDFYDFQTSTNTTQCFTEIGRYGGEALQHSIKSFDFKLNENEGQLYESIEKSIQSLFEGEIPDEQSVLEGNLESSLCLTWSHLTETEIRQPYTVNWNNSISQKALLKSLCIDSRNILFGPKRSNMPHYMANLGAIPLQPVKQPAASFITDSHGTELTDSDRPKQIEAWADTFSGDEQESSNDNGYQSKSSVRIDESKVYQDDVLQPTKTFHNTLPIQAIRQINLPDTHIFTPTDSAIPRSKTIHYDISSSVRLANENVPSQLAAIHTRSSSEMGDFGDFQDFQDNISLQLPGSNESANASNKAQTSDVDSLRTYASKEVLPACGESIIYQTPTILEPIKLEPILPKLNWPEPGEVKETFDDFSDFVSNSSWSNISSSSSNAKENINIENADINNDKNKSHGAPKLPNEMVTTVNAPIRLDPLDDEFDNFQFAPIPLAPKLDAESNSNPYSSIKHHQPALRLNNGLLHPLQVKSMTVPTNLAQSSVATPHSQILEPASEKCNSSPERSQLQQILQPLSLESISQINWPNPGMDIQDLSRFNPIDAVQSLHNSPSMQSSPAHKDKTQVLDDGWGDFVSTKPFMSAQPTPKPPDDDDWSDFVSSATPKQPNGLNTISFNVHSSSSQMRKLQVDPHTAIPALNYITPKTNYRAAKDNQFQNL